MLDTVTSFMLVIFIVFLNLLNEKKKKKLGEYSFDDYKRKRILEFELKSE